MHDQSVDNRQDLHITLYDKRHYLSELENRCDTPNALIQMEQIVRGRKDSRNQNTDNRDNWECYFWTML